MCCRGTVATVFLGAALCISPGGLAQVTEEQAAELTRKVIEVLGEGKLEVADQVFDPMVRMWSPVLPGGVVGLENVKAFARANLVAFPDLTLEIQELLVDGDTIIARFVLSGTHRGPLAGVPPTGRAFRIQGVAVATVEDGKIVLWRDYWNALDLYRALGFRLMPPPASPPRDGGPTIPDR